MLHTIVRCYAAKNFESLLVLLITDSDYVKMQLTNILPKR